MLLNEPVWNLGTKLIFSIVSYSSRFQVPIIRSFQYLLQLLLFLPYPFWKILSRHSFSFFHFRSPAINHFWSKLSELWRNENLPCLKHLAFPLYPLPFSYSNPFWASSSCTVPRPSLGGHDGAIGPHWSASRLLPPDSFKPLLPHTWTSFYFELISRLVILSLIFF